LPGLGLTFAIVKIFTFIFAFYLLFLSAIPCCALDNCRDEAQLTQMPQKHEHHDGCKNCSPFNQCGNCTGFTFSVNVLQIDTPQQIIKPILPVYIQSYVPTYISSFWQPPKLG
jgi:hypothetical protein